MNIYTSIEQQTGYELKISILRKAQAPWSASGRHKANHAGNLVFRSDSTYDPEG
ncbi:hypothetical protein ACFSYB_03850 [Litchfieldia salsa]